MLSSKERDILAQILGQLAGIMLLVDDLVNSSSENKIEGPSKN